MTLCARARPQKRAQDWEGLCGICHCSSVQAQVVPGEVPGQSARCRFQKLHGILPPEEKEHKHQKFFQTGIQNGIEPWYKETDRVCVCVCATYLTHSCMLVRTSHLYIIYVSFCKEQFVSYCHWWKRSRHVNCICMAGVDYGSNGNLFD